MDKSAKMVRYSTLALALCLVACSEAPNMQSSAAHRVTTTETTISTTAPVTVALARQHLDFPFPDTARNIQFHSYREWLAATDLICFEAPVADCLATAQAIIAEHNRLNPQRPVGDLTSALNPKWMVGDLQPIDVPWFRPHEIKQGVSGGSLKSHCPVLWVDTKNGTLYYQYTD